MWLSPGAIVGIILGCLIAGAAIASAIILLVNRHKLFHRSKAIVDNPNVDNPNVDNPNVDDPSNNKSSGIDLSKASWDLLSYQSNLRSKLILDQLPRYAHVNGEYLKGDFAELHMRVMVFVQNYIHDEPVAAETVNSDRLQDVLEDGVGAWTSTQWLDHLCGVNRESALISYLARVLFARIDPGGGDPARTFLPPDVLRVYQATLPGHKATLTDHLTQQLRDYWRTVSAAMLKSQYPVHKIGADDPRLDSINKTYAELLDFLKPFMVERSDRKALDYLKTTVMMFANKGYLFFYHTDPIRVEWPSYSKTEIVHFPKVLLDYSLLLGPNEGDIVVYTLYDAYIRPLYALYDSKLERLRA